MKRLTQREIAIGRVLYPEEEHDGSNRPKTRAECIDSERPCPFVSCEHHLYLDVAAKSGAIKLNFPDLEVEELGESCSLDVAERCGETLERVGEIMNLTRERVRQIEVRALAKLHASDQTFGLRDFVSGGPKGKRKLPVLQDDRDDDDSGFDAERFASDDLADEDG